MHSREEKLEAFGRLLDIMDDLREKCPWDRKQTFDSLRQNTIEESFELATAISRHDMDEICKELGDVLLHVVFYAKMGSETEQFDIADVCNRICDKLIFRHPHVYGEIKNEELKITNALGKAWAIAQTFAFITFTRLFFRSSSNLDPATANEVAWATAKNMVNQIGGAWNNAIIPDFLWEYRWVVAMFVAGMVIHWLPTNWKRRYRLAFSAMPLWLMVIVVCVAIVVIYQFVSAEMQPFIYFQF